MKIEQIESMKLNEGDMIMYSYMHEINWSEKKVKIMRTEVCYYNGIEKISGDDDDYYEWFKLRTKPLCPNRVSGINSWIDLNSILKLNKLEVVQ